VRRLRTVALVDDVMYVFGGRGVGTKDLNDLAALMTPSERIALCVS